MIETLLVVAAVVILFPIVAYFVTKFATYGYFRGRELYRRDSERQNHPFDKD